LLTKNFHEPPKTIQAIHSFILTAIGYHLHGVRFASQGLENKLHNNLLQKSAKKPVELIAYGIAQQCKL